MQPGNIISGENCQFWGPPQCIRQDRPSWLGERIVYDNNDTYVFFNLMGDSLCFDFSVSQGDSSLFFQNPNEKFFLTFSKMDTITILNYTDTAKFYTIIHTDAWGNTINSALNGMKIIIAKTLGLVQFLQVDAFPMVLNPVYLIGNLNPDRGMIKLTGETIYNHAPGDEIQIQVKTHYNYPSPDNKEQFVKFTFLSKILTVDSVIYRANRIVFDKGSSSATEEIVDLKYARNTIIASIPYDYTIPTESGFFNTQKLYLQDYCGLKLWTYHKNQNRGLRYCSADNCWGSNDVPGPPPEEDTVYTLGLGIFSSIYADAFLSPPPSQDYSISSNIIYFKKNGIACGNEAVLGINECSVAEKLFSVYPVPARNFLTIETSVTQDCYLTITTVAGQKVLERPINHKITSIDVSYFLNGIYLVKLRTNNTIQIEKFIKE